MRCFKVWITPALLGLCMLVMGMARGMAQPADTDVPEGDSSPFTTNRAVVAPMRSRVDFSRAGVSVSTDFAGSRLASIRQTGDRSFTAVVAPENYPVNDSAWYAFQIWSISNQTVQLTLQYDRGRHRYSPQISTDGQQWRLAPLAGAVTNQGGRSFTFALAAGPEPLFVAGQELFTSEDYEQWLDQLETRPFVRTRTIGASTLGQPIRLVEITEAGPGADSIVILGRQHPPEVTGTLALQAFVHRLCEDAAPARAFREKFRILIVPVVNPDGVDAGHWRHNAKGVDLNRDWGAFHQAETRAVRDEFLRLKHSGGGKVRFGLDFHSTRKDVFYTTSTEEDLASRWLQALQARLPDYKVAVEGGSTPAAPRTRTAAAWMRKILEVPALTYETGDTTDRALIRRVAGGGADALMDLLLKDESPTAVQDGCKPMRVALYKGAGTGGAGPGKLLGFLNGGTNAVVTQVTPDQIREGILKSFDAIIFAGGSASQQAETIGEAGLAEVQRFIREGGGYIGICAGAYLAMSGFSWGLKVIDAKTPSPKWQRGEGAVKIELTEAGRNILGGMTGLLRVHYQNGPLIAPGGLAALEDFETLAWFRTELAENNTPAGLMIDSPAIVAGSFGEGRVVCFSPHPEQTEGLEPFIENALAWIRQTKGAQKD